MVLISGTRVLETDRFLSTPIELKNFPPCEFLLMNDTGGMKDGLINMYARSAGAKNQKPVSLLKFLSGEFPRLVECGNHA
jgi:hypothetical protein